MGGALPGGHGAILPRGVDRPDVAPPLPSCAESPRRAGPLLHALAPDALPGLRFPAPVRVGPIDADSSAGTRSREDAAEPGESAHDVLRVVVGHQRAKGLVR